MKTNKMNEEKDSSLWKSILNQEDAISDGYEYSRSSTDPEIRLWRKNKSPAKCTTTAQGIII